MREASGFWVMEKEVPSSHHGSVVIFYREADHFAIEEFHLHGPNIISFQLMTGRQRWNVMGCYIAPNDASTIEDVTADIRYLPCMAELLMAGNLNANLAEPEGTPRG